MDKVQKKRTTKSKLEIVCTLDQGERAARGDQWRAVLEAGLRSREAMPDGVRLRLKPDPELTHQLLELVEGERACCDWAHWSVRVDEDATVVEATAPGDGATVLQTLFEVTS